VIRIVLGLAVPGGCTSGPSAMSGEGTGSGDGEGSSSESAITEPLDTSAGEADATGTGPGCGNGVVEAGEICDEQGQTATCDEDCTPVACGDGLVNEAAGEQCDESGASETCNLDCTLPHCGDGTIDAEGETCDGTDLAGETCEGLGYDGGTLACSDACGYETSGCTLAVPVLSLSFSPVKLFDFSWGGVFGAEYYQVLESARPGDPFVQVGGDIVGESVSFDMPLHLRWQASYVLRACNAAGCTDSAAVDVVGSLAEAVGYIKASNTGVNDQFGQGVALSGDGNTLAVGAINEASNATGIGGNQDNNASSSGAVYVFVRDGAGAWSQQAYVKASNTGVNDQFGLSVALSGDGNTLAVGAYLEDSNATGIGGNQANNSALQSGAVYVFVRDGAGAWSQQAYVKASNTAAEDLFGNRVALSLSGDGNALAVGACGEDSNATGIGGNQANNSAGDSGAVYVFVRDGVGAWSQQAYVKASNTEMGDQFGWSVTLSGDGNTLAVGAYYEDSNATGIGGNQGNNSALQSGAVYVFVRDGAGAWSQQAYVKASNTGTSDFFGSVVALAGDGNALAVGASGEGSNATGIGGNQANNSAGDSGAVYVFVRDGAGAWSQQAYVKASNTGTIDQFGLVVALSGDGNALAVGAFGESSSATGIGGNQADDSAYASGAVYVFVRDGAGAWEQQAYIKAPNTGGYDYFGARVGLSGDGNTLAMGAHGESSNAMGIGGNQADDSADGSGAVYLF